MTAFRTYCIGPPVEITVNDDGTVTFDVDVADAADVPVGWDSAFMQMFDDAGQP